MAAHHWEMIARTSGFRPADVQDRVQELVDRMVAAREGSVGDVASLNSVSIRYVEQAAEMIEQNALHIAGRLPR